MKHIKLFESYNIGEPAVGQFVICNEVNKDKNLELFINNNIGKIVTGLSIDVPGKDYYIRYYNIPENIRGHFSDNSKSSKRCMVRREIKYWSSDKSELEILLSANKYNI